MTNLDQDLSEDSDPKLIKDIVEDLSKSETSQSKRHSRTEVKMQSSMSVSKSEEDLHSSNSIDGVPLKNIEPPPESKDD